MQSQIACFLVDLNKKKFQIIGHNYVNTPTPVESGGTYAHLNPPISVIGYHWQLPKKNPFQGFLTKSFGEYSPKIPPLSKNGNTHAAPYAFEGGRSNTPIWQRKRMLVDEFRNVRLGRDSCMTPINTSAIESLLEFCIFGLFPFSILFIK